MTEGSQPKSKAGRKSLGDRPLTNAERVRAYRERMALKGTEEFNVKVEKAEMKALKRIAKERGLSYTAALEQVIKEALK